MFSRNRNIIPRPSTAQELGVRSDPRHPLGHVALHQDTEESSLGSAAHEGMPVLAEDEVAAVSAFRAAIVKELVLETASGIRADIMLTAMTADKRIVSIVGQDEANGTPGRYTVRTGSVLSLVAGEELATENINYDDERVMRWRGGLGTSIELASGETVYVPKPSGIGYDQTPLLIGTDDSEAPLYEIGDDNRPIVPSPQ